MTSSRFFALAVCVLCAGSAVAQTTPAKPAAPVAAPAAIAKPPAPAPAAATPDAAKNSKSKECSLQADAKKLHGKARKKFRNECKKAA